MYLYLYILVASGVVSQKEGQFMRGHKPASQHRTKLRGWPSTCVACATPPPSLPERREAHGMAASCSSVPHAVVHDYVQGKWAKSGVAPTFHPAVRMHASTESNAALPEQVCKQLGNWQIAPELYQSTALCCAADASGASASSMPLPDQEQPSTSTSSNMESRRPRRDQQHTKAHKQGTEQTWQK